jgi:hypothetical protein
MDAVIYFLYSIPDKVTTITKKAGVAISCGDRTKQWCLMKKKKSLQSVKNTDIPASVLFSQITWPHKK